MKKSTKILSLILAVLMMVSMFAACGDKTEPDDSTDPVEDSQPPVTPDDNTDEPVEPETEEGDVLRIYCWNTEFQDRFNAYAADKLPEDLEIEWIITPNEGNAYQDKLDSDIVSNIDSDNPIDIFLIEADYALKYVDTEYALDVLADVGLTDADISDQYTYTQEIATDSNGKLKAVSWQATPGLFAYRRSIAKDVLGTDDPVEVQAALSDWDKFDEVAEKADAKGYKMLSGYDDSYRTFSNNVSAPWVNSSNEIIIDENLMRWVEQTKEYTDKEYNNKTSLWAPEWSADQGPEGKVFGFFYSTWGINFTLLGNSLADPDAAKEVGNGIYGDYAVCEGPQNYYWGGTWICAAAGTDNIEAVRQVMYSLTCDAEVMKQITLDTEDYTNNQTAMGEIANDASYGSAFLGGQNHIALFADAAKGIDMSNIGPYDQGLTEGFQRNMADYFNGNIDLETAIENFYTDAIEKYPNLSKPA
ncbi:ABC transporter substrate-binding protein [Clostridiaceae bacterium OttesenSCG-928-D20]|nr:ABC transporter substrate-binding protein [Clostridiaceae bacterium OttesenSCG-928-D20]